MKANGFVKKFGWGYARELVRKLSVNDTFYLNIGGEIVIEDLKGFVESHDLVESKGGLPVVKADWLFLSDYEKSSPYWVRIKQAIADVESCQ